MGAVLYHLNNGTPKNQNVYFLGISEMHLEFKGRIYPFSPPNWRSSIGPNFENQIGISPSDLLLSWLAEVLPSAKTETGAIKRPEQMFRAEWGAIQAIGEVAFGLIDVFPVALREGLSVIYEKAFEKAFGYGHNGPTYEPHSSVNSRHEVHVAYALESGKPVPDEVINEDYNGYECCDPCWFETVLTKPYTRGRFKSPNHFSTTWSLLKDQVEITSGNIDAILDALAPLDASATWSQIDDALFKAGFLVPRKVAPLPDPASLGVPHNEFASQLRSAMIEWEDKNFESRIDFDKLSVKTEREAIYSVALRSSLPDRHTYKWANRVAIAVEGKDLQSLLSILDGSQNEVTQRSVGKANGVKIHGVSAKQRRRAIFALCGFVDDEAYLAENERLETLQAEQKLEREFKLAQGHTSQFQLKLAGGELLTGAEYVEHFIAQGFTTLHDQKVKKPTRFILLNMETRIGMPVSDGNGTLQYAKLCLERAAVTA